MKRVIIFLSIVTALNVALADSTNQIGNWLQVNVESSGKWFALSQLKAVSDKHLLSKHPNLSLGVFEITANVHQSKSDNLVTFEYFENFGLPVYYVSLDKSAKPLALTSKTASEKETILPMEKTVRSPTSPKETK